MALKAGKAPETPQLLVRTLTASTLGKKLKGKQIHTEETDMCKRDTGEILGPLLVIATA